MRPPIRIGLTILAILAALSLAGCPSGTSSTCPSGNGTSTCDDQPGPGGGY